MTQHGIFHDTACTIPPSPSSLTFTLTVYSEEITPPIIMPKWKFPWGKNPVTPKPQYDWVYGCGSKKSSWIKEQGKETLKNLPRVILQAGVGARVMTGMGAAIQPNQVTQSGEGSSSKKNNVVFLYNSSQSKGLSVFEIREGSGGLWPPSFSLLRRAGRALRALLLPPI